MMMWQPIETAPRDATAILVMRDIWPGAKSGRAKECNGRNTYVAAWWPDERGGQGAWICYMDAALDPECPVEPTHWMPLPDAPSAQPAPMAVAYLDIGANGYMDIGTDLTDEELDTIPKGRHMLGIVGTYGIEGYVPAQPAPSIPEGWKLVPIEPTQEMTNHVIDERLEALVAGKEHTFIDIYKAMLAAAPKPEGE